MINMTEIDEELERIGVSYEYLGPVDCICADELDGIVRFYDDNGEAFVKIADVENFLGRIESAAGYVAFWDAAGEYEEKNA